MQEQGFVEEFEGIRKAEREKEKILESAKKNAEKTVADAEAKAKGWVAKAKDDCGKIEGEILSKAREESEKEEKAIVSRAMKEAEKISAMQVPAAAIRKCVENLVK